MAPSTRIGPFFGQSPSNLVSSPASAIMAARWPPAEAPSRMVLWMPRAAARPCTSRTAQRVSARPSGNAFSTVRASRYPTDAAA